LIKKERDLQEKERKLLLIKPLPLPDNQEDLIKLIAKQLKSITLKDNISITLKPILSFKVIDFNCLAISLIKSSWLSGNGNGLINNSLRSFSWRSLSFFINFMTPKITGLLLMN
jgi:hypothetical protein